MILIPETVLIHCTKKAEKDRDEIISAMQDELRSALPAESRVKVLAEFMHSLDMKSILPDIVEAHNKQARPAKGGLDSIEPGLKAVRTKYGHYIFYKLDEKRGTISGYLLEVVRILDGKHPYMVLSENFIAPSITVDLYRKDSKI